MKTVQSLSRPFGALLLMAALAFGVTTLLPGDLDARERCFCPPADSQLAQGWGMSPVSCAAAKSACQADAQSKAQTACYNSGGEGVCAWGTFVYRPASGVCNFRGGMYKIDCDQGYACEHCIDIPDIP